MQAMKNSINFKVANVFGTRPETIKMNPVLREFAARGNKFEAVNIVTSQHSGLLEPLLRLFDVPVHFRMPVGEQKRSLNKLLSQVLEAFDPILERCSPNLVLVQGDTTSALAGALASHHHQIPVAHVEAGLRTGSRYSPFPEEMNRRVITRLATYHFAATQRNVDTLLQEGVSAENVFLTGNPVVDALQSVLAESCPSESVRWLFDSIGNHRLIVLTTHRRENFGETMRAHLSVLRRFVERHENVTLVFPVHPNPSIRRECERIRFTGSRIILIDPVIYPDFIHLLDRAWLVVSDSGGIQEEVPTLGKGLIVLRETTERPEVVESGFARLVGDDASNLETMLQDLAADDAWIRDLKHSKNPFGNGRSAKAIVDAIEDVLSEGDGGYERVVTESCA